MKRYIKIAKILEQIHIGWNDNNLHMIKYNDDILNSINLPEDAKIVLSNDDPGEIFMILQRSHILEVKPDMLEEIVVTGSCSSKKILKMREFLMGEF